MSETFREAFRTYLQQNPPVGVDFEIDELLDFPKTLEKSAKIRLIEEIIDCDAPLLILKARPITKSTQSTEETQKLSTLHEEDPILTHEGTLNIGFLLENAKVLLHAKDFSNAKTIFTTISRSKDYSEEGYTGLIECEFNLSGENLEEIINDFIASSPSGESLLKIRPFAPAHLQNQISELVSTDESLQKADRKSVWLDRITEAKTRSQLDLAIKLCFQAIAHFSDFEEARFHLSEIYFEQKKYPAARRSLEQVLAINPSSSKSLSLIAQCFVQEGKDAAALDAICKSLKFDLKQPKLLAEAIRLANKTKNYTATIQYLERYIQNHQSGPNVWYAYANLLFNVGKFEDCFEALQATRASHPDYVPAKELEQKVLVFINESRRTHASGSKNPTR